MLFFPSVIGTGTNIFFILSGFLTSRVQLQNEEMKYINPRNVITYYTKKAFRLIPGYIVVVFALLQLIPNFVLWDSLTLVNPWGYLWFIQHMVILYAITPFMFILIYIIKRFLHFNNFMVSILLFAIFVILVFPPTHIQRFWLHSIIPFLRNTNGGTPLRLGTYLFGFTIGYCLKDIRSFKLLRSRAISLLFDIVWIFSLWIVINPDILQIIANHIIIYYALLQLLVLIPYIKHDGFVHAFLTQKAIVKIGQMDYEMYLFHYPFYYVLYYYFVFTHGDDDINVIAFFLTYILCLFTSFFFKTNLTPIISNISLKVSKTIMSIKK